MNKSFHFFSNFTTNFHTTYKLIKPYIRFLPRVKAPSKITLSPPSTFELTKKAFNQYKYMGLFSKLYDILFNVISAMLHWTKKFI